MAGQLHCRDCEWAAPEHLSEWRDRWGQAHESEVIQCRLSGQANYGHMFSAAQVQPEPCSWARILIKQAADAKR